MADETRLSCVVSGRVQDVGFRAFVLTRARVLGLTGRVRNGNDGRTVEITVEGAAPSVEQFLRQVEQGPRMAHVEQVLTTALTGPVRYESFEIER
jgi:acylphosphatase